ncbi:MAG TPA: trypsin-like peptidase domain-containing protein, partial [Acidimicrobiales bacterium]|nr:trypsin-like peptidase domain-containing protein [Acidimicrobiales bacterium]
TPPGPPAPPVPPHGGAPAGSPARPTPPGRGRRVVAVLGAAGLMLVSATGGALLALGLDDNNSTPTTVSSSLATNSASNNDQSAPDEPLSQAAAKVLPSVVSISFRSDQEAGSGSGIIITSDGEILTNNHVVALVANGGSLKVTFADGKTVDAEILGRDPATDLAVIKAKNVSGLKPATFGNSSDLHVGDTVLAIGSPLGLDGSVSAGIVSALDRAITLQGEEQQQQGPFGNGSQSSPGDTAVIDAIQTDAAINPGNSGGALINTQGQVVGINTAIASLAQGGATSQGGNIGVGFAIPIDSARSIATQLAKGDKVTHAFMGVRIEDSNNGDGARIGSVESGQPAEKAGLKDGDVITKVGDKSVTDATDLTAAIRSRKPGDKVTVTYTRDGDTRTAEVTLGELPTDSSN